MKEELNQVDKEVKKEYLKHIKVPKEKPPVQYLLCPIGLVGAGKTTVVKPLAEKLNLVRISSDEIRKILKEKGRGYEDVQIITSEIVEEFLEKGFSVALDADCIREEVQKKIEERRKKFNTKIIWIHINSPEEFILNKLKNLKPNWLGTADDMVKNYLERKPLHENLNFPLTYTFDTSKENLKEQLRGAENVILKTVNSNL